MPRAAAAVAAASRASRLRVPRVPRPLIIAVLVLALLGVGFLVFRESSFVRVENVSISGLTGPESAKLRGLLTDAARDMTTLDVDEQQLRDVVAPYPVVRGLSARPDFPHGLRIDVDENVPVALATNGDRRVPVAGDGTVLEGASAAHLPTVAVQTVPGGARLSDARAMRAVRTLAAAPEALRARVTSVKAQRGGVVATLRDGPELRFGAADRLVAKWAAAAAVLGDASSAGAVYLDLRYPQRPAAGGLEDPAGQLDPETANSAAPAATDPATGAPTTVAPAQGP